MLRPVTSAPCVLSRRPRLGVLAGCALLVTAARACSGVLRWQLAAWGHTRGHVENCLNTALGAGVRGTHMLSSVSVVLPWGPAQFLHDMRGKSYVDSCVGK